jgi:lysophospholipase L1-like esterase
MVNVSGMLRFKGVAFRIGTSVLGFVVSVGLCEITFRLLRIGYGNSPLESHPRLHHVHPRNYEFFSYSPSGEYGGHTVSYDEKRDSTDPDEENEFVAGRQYRVAFLGDSFTEAKQVEFSKTFVGRLKKAWESDATVRNFGVSSYSPLIYLVQWREIVSTFNPTHVVVQLYSNDIRDDVEYSNHAVYDSTGTLSAISGPSRGWVNRQLRKSYLLRFIRMQQLKWEWILINRGATESTLGGLLEENDELSELSKNALLDLFKEIEDVGARVLLTVVPSKSRIVDQVYNAPTPQFSDRWRAWSANNGIPFVDLVEPFEEASRNGKKLFFELDIHFTEEGHAVVAEAINLAVSETFEIDSLPRRELE